MHLPAALSVAKQLLESGDYRGCHRLLADAAREHPGDADAHQALGLALFNLGKTEEALASLQRALEIVPQHAEAHFTRAIVLLALGRYREGLAEYEWRTLRTRSLQRHYYKGRLRWEGQPLDDDALLIHCEQGFGDALQFIRYLPRVRERVKRLHLACGPELKRLFAASFAGLGLAGIAAGDDPLPETRYHCPLLSLPRLFDTTWETIPAPVPYLAGPAPVPAAPPRVALAWRANAASATGAVRSLRLADLLPLTGPPVNWVSLQHAPTEDEKALLAEAFAAEERGSGCADFAATAEALADVDLVICADTALAHLAGALGKPVWTIVPAPTSWRWALARSDTPWYPTMTLFRQIVSGDWGAPVAEIARRLEQRYN